MTAEDCNPIQSPLSSQALELDPLFGGPRIVYYHLIFIIPNGLAFLCPGHWDTHYFSCNIVFSAQSFYSNSEAQKRKNYLQIIYFIYVRQRYNSIGLDMCRFLVLYIIVSVVSIDQYCLNFPNGYFKLVIYFL